MKAKNLFLFMLPILLFIEISNTYPEEKDSQVNKIALSGGVAKCFDPEYAFGTIGLNYEFMPSQKFLLGFGAIAERGFTETEYMYLGVVAYYHRSNENRYFISGGFTGRNIDTYSNSYYGVKTEYKYDPTLRAGTFYDFILGKSFISPAFYISFTRRDVTVNLSLSVGYDFY